MAYAELSDVIPYVRYLLGGEITFNSTTRPTSSEVQLMLDDMSQVIDVALAGEGFAVPVTNSTAKSAIKLWVATKVAAMVELANPGAGVSDSESNRVTSLSGFFREASAWVKEQAPGFRRLGVEQTQKMSDGLAFTGIEALREREDKADANLRQPVFRRGQFDVYNVEDVDDDI